MHVISREFGYGEVYRSSVRNQKYSIRDHIHQFCELIYVFDGELSVTVDGADYTVTKGEAVAIMPFQIHEVHTVGTAHFWMCVFSNTAVPGHSSDKELFFNRCSAKFRPSEALHMLVKDMLEKCPHPRFISNGTVPRKVKAVIYAALSEYAESVKEFSAIKNLNALSALFLYVNEHFREKISLRSISSVLGYNEKYLSQCLSSIPNMSFPTLLGSLRVDHAKKLLIETDFRTIDIAYECGYENEQTFHRTFLRIAGMTPGDYRHSRGSN